MVHRFWRLIVLILALWHDRSQKQMAAKMGMSQKALSKALKRSEAGDEQFASLLSAVRSRQAEVPIVTACVEALDAVSRPGELTEEEQAVVEEGVLEGTRRLRAALIEVALRSRVVHCHGYPGAADLEPARRRAGELLEMLRGLPEGSRSAAVKVVEEYQSWALCELVCDESVREASRNLEAAASWARLAEEIAATVRGPEGWRRSLLGYAKGHGANVLKVVGELEAADVMIEEAKRLWKAGADPEGVLDPGRLLDLEASLRRDQTRFPEALAVLELAVPVSRFPERPLLLRATTYEAMGDYERAIETLFETIALVDRQSEPRLRYILRLNLATNFCHAGRHGEALKLIDEIRPLLVSEGDQIDLLRLTWLDGRIAAGLGRTGFALSALEEARNGFAAEAMFYDVALALLEAAALLLDEGKTTEARKLAQELAEVFESKGVHREALAALQLFREAAEREEATAKLARHILGFLFRARYDQGLRFTAS
jgi:tetratricopeptide (TPR) repeat protein